MSPTLIVSLLVGVAWAMIVGRVCRSWKIGIATFGFYCLSAFGIRAVGLVPW